MAYDRDRFERDRYARDPYRDQSDRDRGLLGRAGDEIRSWFGDDEAQRRRERDERDERYRDERYRDAEGRERWRPGSYGSERGYERDRAWGNEPVRSEGFRDYGDRWGRTYSSAVDRDRDRQERDRQEYGSQSSPSSYGRDRAAFGPEGYGWSKAYEVSRGYGRDVWSSDPWRVPGPHVGRGPRGYRRSDERIREEINDRLTAHGLIDATDVEVRVQAAEVTLTGFVDSREAKRAAEDAAEDVSGVREVNNQLRIRSHADDASGVGRTNVLGLTEQETQTARNTEASRPRGRTT